MDVLDKKTDKELVQSIQAETAKATNEIKTAEADIKKATTRLKFVIMLTHKLIERNGDKQMKLKELAKEPQLTKIVLDDQSLVERYKDPIEFWVYDRVDMSTFMKLANLQGQQQMEEVVNVMKELILDEKGKPILANGKVLPNDVMIKAVEKTVVALGNFVTPTSKTA